MLEEPWAPNLLFTARKIFSTPYSKGPRVLASEGEFESEGIGSRGSRLIVDTSLRLKSTWWKVNCHCCPIGLQDHKQPVLYFPGNQSHLCTWNSICFQSPSLKGVGDSWITRNFDKTSKHRRIRWKLIFYILTFYFLLNR